MYKVCKFGGSSVAGVEQFKQIKNIISCDKDRHIVVVSAVGKANSKDNKVTDLLYLIYQHHKYHVDASHLFDEVKNKYLQIQKDLNLNISLNEEFDKVFDKILWKCPVDYINSEIKISVIYL